MAAASCWTRRAGGISSESTWKWARTKPAVMSAIARPDHRENDWRPARERFWRQGLGPSRWLFVVVDFAERPARVVPAFGRRDDPPGWWTT